MSESNNEGQTQSSENLILLKKSVNEYSHGELDAFLSGFINEHSTISVLEIIEKIKEFSDDDKNLFLSQLKSLLNINDQLKIHPRAFAQLTEEERNECLQITKSLEDRRICFQNIFVVDHYAKFQSITKRYEIYLDKHLTWFENELTKLFEVPFNSCRIFDNIKPFEIVRLYGLLNNNNKMKDYIKVMKLFADLVQVDNIADFCAACEYIYLKLKNDVDSESQCTCKYQAKRSILEKKLNAFINDKEMQQTHCTDYSKLVSECKDNMSNVEISFSSPFTAATHFFKHGSGVLEWEDLNAASYLKKASQLLTKFTDKETKWTQSGMTLKHKYFITEPQSIIIIVENVLNQSKKIVTFYKNTAQKKSL